jgi:hypothetical protein
MLAMFCVALSRDVYESVGPLDECFGIGTLEDDDYSMRLHETGHRLLCAEDVFVHHFGEASFGKLVASGEYSRLLEMNRSRFERKWGTPWRSYGRRLSPDYEELRARIQAVASEVLPPSSTVLVVSRGDDRLLDLDGHCAWHFPQSGEGNYAGHHPGDSEEAKARIEQLRAQGAQYLLFPKTAFWWLDFYEGLRRHLETHYREIARGDTCVIYCLDWVGHD